MHDQVQEQLIESGASEQIFLPGSKLILILGVFSIAGCWIYGIVGLAVGIYTLSLSKKALSVHNNNQRRYDEKALELVKAGRVFAYLGVSVSAIYLIMLFIKIIA